MIKLGLCMNLVNKGVTQLDGFDFNSFAGGVAAGADGLFSLGGDDFAGTAIEAFFEFAAGDLGDGHQKQLRSLHVGYETTGTLQLTAWDDESNPRQRLLSAYLTQHLQHSGRVNGGYRGKGRYWSFRVENVSGCDFSVDTLEGFFILLARKGSRYFHGNYGRDVSFGSPEASGSAS